MCMHTHTHTVTYRNARTHARTQHTHTHTQSHIHTHQQTQWQTKIPKKTPKKQACSLSLKGSSFWKGSAVPVTTSELPKGSWPLKGSSLNPSMLEPVLKLLMVLMGLPICHRPQPHCQLCWAELPSSFSFSCFISVCPFDAEKLHIVLPSPY